MSSPWQLQLTDLKSRSQHIFETKVLSDCYFLVGKEKGHLVEGHKFILSIASPVFHEKLKATRGDHPKITISDVEPEVFQSMLKYIYMDSIEINANIVYELAAAAKSYQLPSLLKACFDHIAAAKLTLKNVLQAYSLALHTAENDLKKKCEEFIRKNTKEVLAESSFEEACPDVVEAMFSLENLNIDSELDLLNAADRYAKHISKCKVADKTSIQNILAKIRFLSLTPEEFAKGQTTTSVISASDACAILTHIAYYETDVPMPPGFSLRRDVRKKVNVSAIKSLSEMRFEFSVPGIENLIKKDEDAYTSTFILQDLKWKLYIGKRVADSVMYLGVFTSCNWESLSWSWSCLADIDIFLQRSDKGDSLNKKYSKNFSKKENNWGYDNFIKISELLDLKNHYIKDGAITFKIHIKADKPKGL